MFTKSFKKKIYNHIKHVYKIVQKLIYRVHDRRLPLPLPLLPFMNEGSSVHERGGRDGGGARGGRTPGTRAPGHPGTGHPGR